ncbi:MAG: PspA/IM30 family protein [Woeseia sp.]
MTIVNRITQLFKADFHAVLDHIEEPELLLRQAIRDMEAELARQEQQIRSDGHKQAELKLRQKQLEQRLHEFDEELDLGFGSGKEDLAKGLIRRKLETQRLLVQLASREGLLSQATVRRQALFTQNRTTLEGLRQKADLFVLHAASRRNPDQSDHPHCMNQNAVVSDDEVEVAFLREQEARSAA